MYHVYVYVGINQRKYKLRYYNESLNEKSKTEKQSAKKQKPRLMHFIAIAIAMYTEM